MPWRDPDPQDPTMLVGVELPGGPQAARAMAMVFADEFARMGHAPHEIFALFENPYYAGPHAALGALGVPAVLLIVREAAARWPAVRVVDAPAPEGREG